MLGEGVRREKERCVRPGTAREDWGWGRRRSAAGHPLGFLPPSFSKPLLAEPSPHLPSDAGSPKRRGRVGEKKDGDATLGPRVEGVKDSSLIRRPPFCSPNPKRQGSIQELAAKQERGWDGVGSGEVTVAQPCPAPVLGAGRTAPVAEDLPAPSSQRACLLRASSAAQPRPRPSAPLPPHPAASCLRLRAAGRQDPRSPAEGAAPAREPSVCAQPPPARPSLLRPHRLSPRRGRRSVWLRPPIGRS